jgi:hypothetical protein
LPFFFGMPDWVAVHMPISDPTQFPPPKSGFHVAFMFPNAAGSPPEHFSTSTLAVQVLPLLSDVDVKCRPLERPSQASPGVPPPPPAVTEKVLVVESLSGPAPSSVTVSPAV